MADFAEDPDVLIARVQEQVAQAQQRAQAAQQMRAEVEALRGTATSARREVSVTVDASGRLIDVDLADAALDLRARDLGRLIVATAGAAQRDAGEQAVAVASRAFGDDSPVVDRLRAELDARTASGEE
ncbi:YbaB/EbfC family nucleoid-associated protein [Microbacterium sp.]|uniref:YbaB/EbfC family nucleoid-associated protein n=1 Tax=Microbacterium sp. TaxID=51671 RepID=UPI003A93AC15